MNDTDDFVGKTIVFIETQVCPLTDLNKCRAAVEQYSLHKNELRLVDDVFDVLIKCDEKRCVDNTDKVKTNILGFLEKNKV